jgi:DUF1680 family protein
MEPMRLGELYLKGEIEDRLARSVRHLRELNAAEMRREMVRPDTNWHWGADYIGRWIGVMAQLGRYTGQDLGAAEVAHELVSYQNQNGSLGLFSEPHDHKEWVGMGRGLVGLLEFYGVQADQEILQAATRLGLYYESHYPDLAECMYECYANGLEGLVRLAQLTGDERHLRTAQRVAETSMLYRNILYSKEFGPDGKRTPCSGHIHCHLMTARGLLDLFEVTSETRFLAPVTAFWELLVREMLWISGGLGEFFHYPEHNEACADADWLRLNLQLWRITGHDKYMELAECILLNQLLFAQADNGAFCYRRGLQNNPGSAFDACCSHHGPRALLEATRYVFARDEDLLSVNLYPEGDSQLLPSAGLAPLSNRVAFDGDFLVCQLSFQDSTPASVKVSARIPAWAGGGSLILNEVEVQRASQAGRVEVERRWKTGDRLEIRLPLQVRVVEGIKLGSQMLDSGHVAVFLGPRLMVLDGRYNPEPYLPLVQLRTDSELIVEAPDRILAQGITHHGAPLQLVLTPLAGVGGRPNEMGRIHPVGTQYFRAWHPCV